MDAETQLFSGVARLQLLIEPTHLVSSLKLLITLFALRCWVVPKTVSKTRFYSFEEQARCGS